MANSSYISGLSDVYDLTAKIAELKRNADSTQTTTSQAVDPDTFILNMQKSFNSMLNSLMFSTNSDDDDNSADPFAGFYNSFNNTGQTTANPTQSTNLALNLLNMQQLDINI